MARTNYAYAKRQRDLAKKKKREAKRLKKAAASDTPPPDTARLSPDEDKTDD